MACPFRDDSYACSSHLQEREIRAVSAYRVGAGSAGVGGGGRILTLPVSAAGVAGGVPAVPGEEPGAGGAAQPKQFPLQDYRLPGLVHL